MNAFSWIFVAALFTVTAIRLWLAFRQIAHVRAHRCEVPAAFAASIPVASHQRAADYTVAKTRLAVVEILVAAGVLVALTLGGLLQFLAARWAQVFDPGGIAHGTALIASVTVLLSLVELPASLYRVFVLEERFGFNRMTPLLFIQDLARQTGLALVIGVPLLMLVLWLMQAMGSLWWLYVWLAWSGFNLLVLLVYPTFIAPIFNRFSPLADRELAQRIEGLLARCGFRSSGLFVMDGSRRSSHGNAYFTGIGAAKRIVLFDTLLARLSPREVEAVLAHELGHFRLRHVLKRIAVLFGFSFAMLWVLGLLIGQDWFYAGLNVSTRTPAIALLLFVLVVPVFTFFLHPLTSLYSRKHEYEADAYAAAHADAADLIRALVKLYQDNASTLTPDPVHSAVYDSHPPAAARVARLQQLQST